MSLERYQPIYDVIDRDFDASVAEIQRFLRQPGFSHTGEGIRETATMALEYTRMLGTENAELVETGGNPVVHGVLRSKRPDAKTLIIYSLYDEVPVIPADWTFPPLEARIVEAQEIGAPAHLGKVICARATHNQRGPMLATILTLKAIQAATGDIPVNVIWAWEGEEEIGCPNLWSFVEQRMSVLQTADAFWMPSMRQDEDGRMIVNRGYKGTIKIELTIKGGEWGGTLSGKDLWSANLPFVDSPYLRMIRALASLFDDDDTCVMDGFRELVRDYTDEEREEVQILEERFNEATMKQALGIARFRGGRSGKDLVSRYVMEPMLNVVGIVGGYSGPRVFTTIPMDVTAKLDFRLVPEQRRDDIPGLLRAHLDRRGFAEAQINVIGGYEYSRTPASDPVYQAAIRACQQHTCEYIIWPTVPAVGPFGMFNRPPLDKPAIYVGMGHGARAHQRDEYITVEGIRDFMKYTVTFLHEFGGV
ncbi:MAG: M20/M25/M40 family metallo-hydrolase [Chloroflexi bacterium]|nr:M20/M25/M40 family metallo-hydrolase [Chloroflexota bacterium]